MRNKKLLKEIKARLTDAYPDLIESVILFGSRIFGGNRTYSDYDILIIFKNDYDWKTENGILDVCYDINLEYEIILDVKIISRKDLASVRGKQPFIINALNTGISV